MHRSVKRTKIYGLFYDRNSSTSTLEIFVDTCWSSDLETRRSTTEINAFLGIHTLDLNFKLRTLVTHKTSQSQFVAVYSAYMMALLLRSSFSPLELETGQGGITTVHEDNAACLFLDCNEWKFLHSKHTEIRYHYLQEKIEENKSYKIIYWPRKN